MGTQVDIVVMGRGRRSPHELLADTLPKTLGDGPHPPGAGTVQVRYAGWHVDDGDAPLHVGQAYPFRLLLHRHEDVTPTDWSPHISAAPADAPMALRHLPHVAVPATYSFVGEAFITQSTGHAEWTAVEAGFIRFAVPGRHVGRVRGTGSLEEDTYMIDGVGVPAGFEQPLGIVRIQALRHVFTSGGRSGSRAFAGYAPPVDVGTTADRLAGSAGDHTFVMDVRPPT